jgi:hypothetical protein
VKSRFGSLAAVAPITGILFALGPSARAAAPIQLWPETPPWMVVLGKGERSPVCTALAPRLNAEISFIAGIAFSRTSTHFYVQFLGKAPELPETMNIFADQQLVYGGPIERFEGQKAGGLLVRIDLPGDTLLQKLMPALLHASALRVQFGDTVLNVPTQNMGQVRSDLAACVETANKMGL